MMIELKLSKILFSCKYVYLKVKFDLDETNTSGPVPSRVSNKYVFIIVYGIVRAICWHCQIPDTFASHEHAFNRSTQHSTAIENFRNFFFGNKT